MLRLKNNSAGGNMFDAMNFCPDMTLAVERDIKPKIYPFNLYFMSTVL